MATNYLIVEQQITPPENLPDILKELSHKFKLDNYQCRQRLTGRGMSVLTKGTREQLEKISLFLQLTSYIHWIVEPSKNGFVPLKIRNIQAYSERIIFGCQKKEVTFTKGATILAVFAEVTGKLIDKSVSQLLSSHAYRGKDNVRHLEQNKIHKTILQGKPVLDLYLLDDTKQVKEAVRIFPGKFDPQGMGERASLSSRQNLYQVLELAKELAGEFHLQTDFGLVNLPGCTLRRENPDNPETQRQNLLSLARYGWMMVDLLQAGAIKPPKPEPTSKTDHTDAVTAAILLQNPALAGIEQLADIIPSAIKTNERVKENNHKQKEQVLDNGLPAPPPAKSTTSKTYWFSIISTGLLFGLLSLTDILENQFIQDFAFHAFASGAVPIIITGLLVWYGFYFLRLKRQIENTPTSKVRSIAMGMVEVKGQAVRSYALISPMSNTPCVYYRLTKYKRDRNRQWRVSSISSSDNVPFMLEDETGRVEINPTAGQISAGSKHEGSPGQVGLMQLNNNSEDKWVEEVIVDGTLLYILGYATAKRSSGTSLHTQKIEALRELKQNTHKLKQFDHDGDGKISAKEWDNARNAVEAEVLEKSLQNRQQRKKQEEHIVIAKHNRRPLIIAETHSEKRLTTRYFYYSATLFAGAAIAVAGSIYLLLTYLN